MALLTREIELVVARLRAAFDPEEIILFGSHAYGVPRPDSDTDLLLVLRPTDEPPERRRARAETAVAGGGAGVRAHVFPYTVDEIRQRLAGGDTAVRDALSRGLLLHPSRPDATGSRHAELAQGWCMMAAAQEWLDRAREDLDTADALLPIAATRLRQWWVIANHAQQAAEKALKALIFHLGGEPDRTHSVTDLLLAADGLDRATCRPLLLRHQARLAELAPYAVLVRYPGGPAVGEEQASRAVETARDLLGDIEDVFAAGGGGAAGSSEPAGRMRPSPTRCRGRHRSSHE